MTRRWGRLLRFAGVQLAGLGLDVGIELLTDGWPFGVGLGLGVVTNLVLYWVELQAAKRQRDDPPPPPPPPLPDWLIRRHEEARQVIAAVLARRAGAVGITTGLHGAGGFGKTTMAHVVANDRRVRRRFGNRVYVIPVGQDVKGPAQVARLVNQAVALITGETPTFTNPRLAGDHLARVLDERPPILLIIDDVWEREQLEPFLRGGKRCVRLVTTRIADLLPAGAHPVLVDTMREDQARALLTWKLGGTISAPLQEALLRVTRGWALLLHLVNRAIAVRIAAGAHPDGAARTVLEAILADPAWVDPDHPLDVANPDSRAGAVSATINASTNLLTRGQRQRLAELSIFAEDESVPVDLIARLWQATGGLTLEESQLLCHELRRLALVTVITDETGAKVRLHDAVRAYLRAQLGPRLPAVHAALVNQLAATLPAATALDRSIRAPAVAWWKLGEGERYLDDHLPDHLAAAGLDDQRDALVTDLRWVGRRLRRYGPAAPAADAARADTDLARSLGLVLGQTAHLLAPTDTPESVIDILLSRLRDDPQWTAAADHPDAAPHRPRLAAAWPLPDRADPALLRTLTGHTEAVWAVAWSPDGSCLATAGEDCTVRIWNPTTGTTLAHLSGHTDAVWAVAWSPDGSRLATASADRTVRIWNPTTGTTLAHLSGHTDAVLAVAWSPDGSRLATAGDDRTVRIWNPTTATTQLTLTGHTDAVHGMAWSPDGTRLATTGADRTVRIWNPTTATTQLTLTGHTRAIMVNAVAWSPDGKRLAAAGSRFTSAEDDGTAWIWNLATPATPETTLAGHTDVVYAVAWSPDGTGLATASADRAVRIWNPATATAQTTSTAHAGTVYAVAWSPAGRRLATSYYDGTVRIWHRDHTAAQITLTAHASTVSALAWSPDGKRLATASYDRTARIWNPATGTTLATLTGHTDGVKAVAWSPDGSLLATAGWDRTVRIWNPTTATTLTTLTGHTDAVMAVAWSPDGQRLATASRDQTLRVWDATSGACLALMRVEAPLSSCAWSPEGTLIALGGHRGVYVFAYRSL